MPEYLSPGVYVEEVERGAKPIEGVSTSTAGFLGRTERGPTDPRLVTSFADYKRIYGSYIDESYLAYAVEGFFVNGGGRAYVGRVADAETGTADGSLIVDGRKPEPEEQTEHLWATNDVIDFGDVDSSTTKTLMVDNIGESGDSSIAVAESDLEVSDSTLFSVTTASGSDLSIAPSDDPVGIEVTYNPPSDPESVRETLTIPHDGENTPVEVELRAGSGAVGVEAVGPGSWGGHVAVIVDDGSMYSLGENQLFKLTLRYWADEDDLAVAMANDADTEEDAVPDPDAEEVYDDLSPVESSSNYYVSVVDGASNLVDLSREQPGRPAKTDGAVWLDGPDSDGTPALGDWNGNAEDPPDERTGFAGLDSIDDISIYCVPDEHAEESPGATAIRDRCLELEDRFAILQAEQSPGNPGDVTPSVNSDYAAY
ncbi:MAG TPA: hypothetical protein VKA37_12445, partial [Halobacteriales archaeon]|nr:hypothetical protein [Halobacteriales archaeon]